jgi:predicted nucleic acid-binding protein
MILVDTSALIAFFKGVETHAARKLKSILEQRVPFGINGLIFQEILQGAKSESEYETLRNYRSTQQFYTR